MSNHLGNVMEVVTDRKLAVGSGAVVSQYTADVVSYSDYYPYHMQKPNRYGGTYRYLGANGQESETEITGSNSHSSAEYWMYDNRLGRRWNLEPQIQKLPWISPYSTYLNNPIIYQDPNGDIPILAPLIWTGIRWVGTRLLMGMATSWVIQMAVYTTIYEGDFIKAFNNVDMFDVAKDGAITVLTGGFSHFGKVFQWGTKTKLVTKAGTVLLLEVVGAAFDYKLNKGEIESVFNGDKNLGEFTLDLVFSMAEGGGQWAVKSKLLEFAKKDFNPKTWAILSKAERSKLKSFHKFLQGKLIQKTVIEDGGTWFGEVVNEEVQITEFDEKFTNFLENLLKSDVKVTTKTTKTNEKINNEIYKFDIKR